MGFFSLVEKKLGIRGFLSDCCRILISVLFCLHLVFFVFGSVVFLKVCRCVFEIEQERKS